MGKTTFLVRILGKYPTPHLHLNQRRRRYRTCTFQRHARQDVAKGKNMDVCWLAFAFLFQVRDLSRIQFSLDLWSQHGTTFWPPRLDCSSTKNWWRGSICHRLLLSATWTRWFTSLFAWRSACSGQFQQCERSDSCCNWRSMGQPSFE